MHAPAQRDWVIGNAAIELVAGRHRRAVGSLTHDPRARRKLGGSPSHRLEDGGASRRQRRAVQVEIEVKEPRGVLDVAVRVDEPGNDGAAGQLDDAGPRPDQRRHLGPRADCDDAVAANRHRLRDAVGGIERNDPAAAQHEIRRRRGLLRRGRTATATATIATIVHATDRARRCVGSPHHTMPRCCSRSCTARCASSIAVLVNAAAPASELAMAIRPNGRRPMT